MLVLKEKSLNLLDERNPFDLIFNGGVPCLTYTLKTDDITKGEKPSATPYASRLGEFENVDNVWKQAETGATMQVFPHEDGVRMVVRCDNENLSEWGISLPFNFQGKKYGGGWRNQFLFNSPYITNDRKFKSFYLTKANGAHLLVVVLSDANGWKMDYSPFLAGAYFMNLKLLANFDKAFGHFEKKNGLTFGIYPVDSYEAALEKMSKLFSAPFMYADFNAGKCGNKITLRYFGDCDSVIEKRNGIEKVLEKTDTYTIEYQQEVELIPCYKGVRGAGITVYGYNDIIDLYKKSMDTVDLDVIKQTTDSNLCEHQCWAPAMLRFLMKYSHKLTETEKKVYEEKVLSLLDRVTETDETKAEPRLTIFKRPFEGLPAYNVFRSQRIQEQFFGVTLLLDAYKYFKDEKYYEYAVGAMDCLLNHYQRADGRMETNNCMSKEDYTSVCCIMIPLTDMAHFLKGKDDERSKRYFKSASWIAEYLYRRGWVFNTEGGETDEAEKRLTDCAVACTVLNLLYYCAHVKKEERYMKFAKEVLDVHDCWVMKSPIAQMRGSSLRWWETLWEGDADGPALNCGHAWTICRAECDWLYYELTGDEAYKAKSINSFNTNFAKINADGDSFAIYNVDDINGGGFHGTSDEIEFKIAEKFPKQMDCGLSRYAWLRATECVLKIEG